MTEYTPIFSIAEVLPINSFPVSRRGFLLISLPNHQMIMDTMLRTTKKPGYKP